MGQRQAPSRRPAQARLRLRPQCARRGEGRAAPRGARRYRSGPPRTLGGYPYQDIIGIDPGALPTEVTPAPERPVPPRMGRRTSKATGESRWDAAVREMGMLLRYTGPIFGCVVGSLAPWCLGH